MIIGEDRQNPVPLRAIAEALAATLDRDSGLMLKGEDLPPSAAESFRPSTKKPGTFRSTVKKELAVPPALEFCYQCHNLLFPVEELSECTKCTFPTCCSRECQKLNWHEHRKVCDHLATVKEQGGWLEHQ